ncbi:MAG: nuclear transport factor 2 family protein [Gemmatimonadota bacterium]|nr:nuclear transport factor 2 family protein [Gemmatimonadota bacterium]
MGNVGRFTMVVAGSLLLLGCNKPTPATADSAAVSSTSTATFDETAARAQILGADSAFQRALVSKHVDSLMVYYDPDVVSMGANAKPIKGTTDLRANYDKAVKTNNRNLSFQSGGVNFSNDHTMAWDHGTYTGTSDGPDGKPVTHSGSFLNVWKNVGGRWLIVAEIGT